MITNEQRKPVYKLALEHLKYVRILIGNAESAARDAGLESVAARLHKAYDQVSSEANEINRKLENPNAEL